MNKLRMWWLKHFNPKKYEEESLLRFRKMMESYLNEIGEVEIRHRLDRGDYHDPVELTNISKWLRSKDDENRFLEACRKASVSAALDASRSSRHANYIAMIAVFLALIANHQIIRSFMSSIFAFIKP